MLRGKFFYKGRFVEAGIRVEDGVITEIGKLVEGRKVRGVILPAGIDVHVHFRDFREKQKETIETGSLSAVYGGICLVIDQPNTIPPIDNFEIYDERMKIARKKCYVDYALNLALTNKNIGKINQVIRKVKRKYFLPAIGEVFLQHKDRNFEISYESLKFVSKGVHKITVHAEDPEFVTDGIPNFVFRKREAEITAVKKCLAISNFHFCHISTRDAVKLILNSNSTFEVTPHHLLLSVENFKDLGEFVNVNPPLRSREESFWMLKNFSLADVLASDHAPHLIDEKASGAPGFPGVETMYPMFVALALKGIISFKDLVEKISENPARIFNLRGYGEIEVGNFANFAVFDFKAIEKIDESKLHSKCGWTPFKGFEAIFPREVYIRGIEVLKTEEKVGKVL